MASDAGRVIPLPKGAWNALTTYETLDIVSYGNQTWMAKLSSIGITPTEGQYWTVYGSTAAMASTTAMGIVKIPTDGTITIDSDGTIHSAGGSASSISTTDPSKSVQDVLDDLDADKADSATTLAGYGITDAKIESGTITLGNNTLKPVSTVDTALSDTSTNPVQNKVINTAINTLSNEKVNTTDVYGTSDEYNSVASYVVGDMCIHNEKLYKCIKACSGVAPTDTDYWENVSLDSLSAKLTTILDGELLYTVYESTFATGTFDTGKNLLSYKFIMVCADFTESVTYRRYAQSKWYKVSEIPTQDDEYLFVNAIDFNVNEKFFGVNFVLRITDNTKFQIAEAGKHNVTSINSVKFFGFK